MSVEFTCVTTGFAYIIVLLAPYVFLASRDTCSKEEGKGGGVALEKVEIFHERKTTSM